MACDAVLRAKKAPDAARPRVRPRLGSHVRMKIPAEALLFDNDGTLVSSLESVVPLLDPVGRGVRHHRPRSSPGSSCTAARPPR